VTINNGNVLPGSVTFNNNRYNYSFSGSNGIAGGSLTLNGSGTVTISTSNGFTGGTQINAGTLVLGNSAALGASSGTLGLSGGMLDLHGFNVTLGGLNGTGGLIASNGGSPASLTVNTPAAAVFNGSLANNTDGQGGTLSLVKSGTGTLTLGGANTNSGTTTIAAGGVQLANSAAVQNSTVVITPNNGLTFAAFIGTFNVGGLSGAGNESLVDAGLGSVTLNVGGNNAATTYSGILSGSGGLTKVGGGNTTLTAQSAYDGATIVSSGTLTLSGNSGDSSSGLLPSSAITVAPGAVLNLNGSDLLGYSVTTPLTVYGTVYKSNNQSETLTRNITLSGGTLTSSSAASATGNGAWDFGDGAGTIGTAAATTNYINGTGAFSLRYASALFNVASNSVLNISVPVNQNTNGSSSPLNLAGSGLLVLSASNLYGGVTNIYGGTLEIAGSGDLGSGNNYSAAISDSGALFLNTSSNQTFSGVISGPGGLAQAGPGSLTLSASNKYGGTTLSGGGLVINNNGALGTGPFAITGGTINSTTGAVLGNVPMSWNGSFVFAGSNSLNLGTGTVSLAGNSQVTTNANTLTVGGAITGGYSLATAGPGTLSLLGNGSYTGGTTITAGALQLGNSASNASLAGNIIDNGTINYAGAGAQQLAGVLSGTGNLAKTAAGTLTLTASNPFTGPTNVNAGTLIVNGSLPAAGAVNIAGGAALSGSGSVGLTTLASGGTVDVSQNGANSLTLASLDFSGNATINFGAFSNYTSILAVNGGAVVPSSLGSVDLTFPGGTVPDGTFRLLGFSSLGGVGSGAFALVRPSGLGARQTPTLTDNGSQLDLVVTGDYPIWTGANGTAWVGQNNWVLANAGTVTDFEPGDTVQFNDTAGTIGVTNTTVTISAGNVFPTSVAFNNNTLSYSLSGAYGIAGAASLSMNGSGTLTIANSNSYSGGTQLNAGRLNINNTSAIGTGTLVISGGTLDNTSGAAITLSTNNPQNWNSNFTFNGSNNLNLGTGAVTLAGSTQVTVNRGNLTVGGPIGGVGASLALAGNGQLTLGGANSYNSGTLVLGGTLTAANDAALSTGPVTLSPASGLAVLAFTSGSPSIGSLASSGGGASAVVLGNAVAGSPTVLTIGSNGVATTFSGTISDRSLANPEAVGSLAQVGAGSLTLTQSNSFTGGATLSGGAVVAGSPAALGAGPVTLNGGTLQSGFAGNGGSPAMLNNVAVNPVSGSALYAPAGYDLSLSGNLSGAGTVSKLGPNSVYLGGNNAAFNGEYVQTQGNTYFGGSGGAGSGLATWVVNAGNLANTAAGPVTISLGALSGSGGTLGNNDPSGGQVTYAIGALGASTQFSGPIVDSIGGGGTTAVTLAGGTLNLGAANTFSGPTLVNQGVLELSGSGNPLNNGLYASSSITVNNGGEILVNQTNALQGYADESGPLMINAGGLVTISNGIASHISGPLVLNGGTLASGTANGTLGSWSIDFDVQVEGTATSTMSGLDMNWSGTRTFTVSNAAGTLYVPGTFSSPGGMTGALVKSGPGLMLLASANAYSGGTIVNSGTLAAAFAGTSVAGTLPAGEPITVNAGATLQLDAKDALGYYAGNSSEIILNGGILTTNGGAFHDTMPAFDLTAGTITAIGAGDSSGNYILDGTITTNAAASPSAISTPGAVELRNNNDLNGNSSSVTFNVARGSTSVDLLVASVLENNADGSNGLILTGNGIMELAAANTYTGGTTISGGTLQLGNGTPGNDGSITGSVLDNAALVFDLFGSQVYAGAITGNGSVSAIGPGLIVLTGNNSYAGGTAVSNGRLQLGNAAALGTGSLAANGGTLDLAGYSVTVPSFSGAAGAVTNSQSGTLAALTVDQLGVTTFGGTISDGAGQVQLDLTGPGTLILTGTSLFSGGTFVSAGILVLDSPSSLEDGSSLTVGQGASAIFSPGVAAELPTEPPPAGVAAVPEPGTLLLLVVAVLGIAAISGSLRRQQVRSAGSVEDMLFQGTCGGFVRLRAQQSLPRIVRTTLEKV
jgi:fibronectin-binding autotransporter adhesin